MSAVPKVTAVDRLVHGIDEAISLVTDILESSTSVQKQFRTQRDAVLNSYQTDIGRMDNEYEQILVEQKRRKKALWQCKGQETNHALNHHMSRSEIFMLRSGGYECIQLAETVNENSITIDSSYLKLDNLAQSNNIAKQRAIMRSDLLNKMENFRVKEAQLLKQIEDIRNNGMMSTQGLEDNLGRCRVHNAQEIVKIVNDYRPKLRKKTIRNLSTSGNINCCT